jgi:predicted nucleotidyltransferase
MDLTLENEITDRFLRLGWDRNEVKSVFEIVDEFESDFEVKRISIYGSMARGTQNDESDIDVGIETSNSDYFKREDRQVNTDNGQGRNIQVNFFPFGFDERSAKSNNKEIRYLAQERVRDKIVLHKKI